MWLKESVVGEVHYSRSIGKWYRAGTRARSCLKPTTITRKSNPKIRRTYVEYKRLNTQNHTWACTLFLCSELGRAHTYQAAVGSQLLIKYILWGSSLERLSTLPSSRRSTDCHHQHRSLKTICFLLVRVVFVLFRRRWKSLLTSTG